MKKLFALFALGAVLLPFSASAYSYNASDYSDVLEYTKSDPTLLQQFQQIYDKYYVQSVKPIDDQIAAVPQTILKEYYQDPYDKEKAFDLAAYGDGTGQWNNALQGILDNNTRDLSPHYESIKVQKEKELTDQLTQQRTTAISLIKDNVKNEFLPIAASKQASQIATGGAQTQIASTIPDLPWVEKKANWDALCEQMKGAGWVSDDQGMNCIQKTTAIVSDTPIVSSTDGGIVISQVAVAAIVPIQPKAFVGQPKTRTQLLSCDIVVSKFSHRTYKKGNSIIRTMAPKWAVCK